MSELHVLVDFENVQPTMDDLIALAPELKDVWLFHGPTLAKRAAKVKGDDARVTLVPHSGKGKNALDFHLTFYLGYLAAKRTEPRLLVVSNDQGYDSMLDHAKSQGLEASRVGFKGKEKPAAKKVAAARKAVSLEKPLAAPVPAKKAAAKKPPAKKVAAKTPAPATPATPATKKNVAKKVAAKKAAAKQVPAKAVPAKKTAAKKAAPKKAPAQKSTAVSSAPAAKPASKAAAPKAPVKAASADKVLARAKASLSKMGKNRPTKLSKLLRHLTSIVGQGATLEQADALSRQLEEAKVIQVVGDLVLYP
ncbi:PIN domain-containing protein [Hydrogenophaga sp. NFH-34]|uniref:PIN domain-containing protein n=1 Tax=Hydrogenophaga sp. NFH-34 TaxID=2744446 RepID=UPI001F45DEDC|nr:PIN domain-containing protein [Hydrogenophaga sp. NFH-34]